MGKRDFLLVVSRILFLIKPRMLRAKLSTEEGLANRRVGGVHSVQYKRVGGALRHVWCNEATKCFYCYAT
jgi:hypothetical protein